MSTHVLLPMGGTPASSWPLPSLRPRGFVFSGGGDAGHPWEWPEPVCASPTAKNPETRALAVAPPTPSGSLLSQVRPSIPGGSGTPEGHSGSVAFWGPQAAAPGVEAGDVQPLRVLPMPTPAAWELQFPKRLPFTAPRQPASLHPCSGDDVAVRDSPPAPRASPCPSERLPQPLQSDMASGWPGCRGIDFGSGSWSPGWGQRSIPRSRSLLPIAPPQGRTASSWPTDRELLFQGRQSRGRVPADAVALKTGTSLSPVPRQPRQPPEDQVCGSRGPNPLGNAGSPAPLGPRIPDVCLPVALPGTSGCWAAVPHRLRDNLSIDSVPVTLGSSPVAADGSESCFSHLGAFTMPREPREAVGRSLCREARRPGEQDTRAAATPQEGELGRWEGAGVAVALPWAADSRRAPWSEQRLGRVASVRAQLRLERSVC